MPRKAAAPTEGEEEASRPKHSQERVTEGQVPVLERPTYAPITEEARVKLNLWQKRAHIIEEIGNVPKRGYNAFHKYHYALEADVTAYLAPLLAKYMVVIDVSVMLPTDLTLSTPEGEPDQTVHRPGVERIEPKGDSKLFLTRLPLLITIINADQPAERVDVVWYGEGADSGDKGIYKAYTGALKFFYMKWFLIATGDDPEAFDRVDQMAAGGSGGSGVRVESSGARQPAKGGRQAEVTEPQIRSLAAMSRALQLGGEDADDAARVMHTAMIVDEELGTDLVPQLADLEGDAMRAKFVELLKANYTGEQIGKVLYKMGQMEKEKKTDEGTDTGEGYGS